MKRIMSNSWNLQLTMVGTNHKHAPIEVRERLWCPSESLPTRLRNIVSENKNIQEVVILSTCNRTEIYAISSRDPNPSVYLTNMMMSWCDIPDLKECIYSLSGDEAARHLIMVASGLDSLVLGEEQIRDQVREAARTAARVGTIDRFLSGLFQHAYTAAAEIRNRSGLGPRGSSVSSAAIFVLKDLARESPINLILLVGAGKMISLAAEDLSTFPGIEVWVANRNFQRAKDLAARFRGKPIEFGEIPTALQKTDVVLTCTSSSDYIITAQDLERLMSKRGDRRLIVIDTAVPRNVDPAAERVPGIRLFNIDDLSPFVKNNDQSTQTKITKAEEFAHREAEKFYARMRAYNAADTLKDLRRVAEDIREKELSRALRRLGNVPAREKEIVDLLTQRIVNKLLFEPTTRLKEHASNGDSETYEAVIRELFAISRDREQ